MSQPELFPSFSTEELSKCFVPKYLNLTGSCPKLENKMWKERLYTRDFINGQDFLLEFIISLFVIPTLLPGFVMYAQMKIERAHTFGPLTSTTFGKLLSTFAFCVIVFFHQRCKKGTGDVFLPPIQIQEKTLPQKTLVFYEVRSSRALKVAPGTERWHSSPGIHLRPFRKIRPGTETDGCFSLAWWA